MVNEPLISIIMATHNRPILLQERSIPSVLRQTYQNWELLIRGDGADTSTELAINSLNDPRIKYKNLPRRLYANPREQWSRGGAHASNAALEDARGTYVAHLNDDDEFLPRHLETLSRMLMSGDYDFVYGRVYFETDNAWIIFGEPFDKERLERENIMAYCSVMYDRAKLGHLRFDTNPSTDPGDWCMWKRMAAAGARFGHTKEIVAVHYVETAFREHDTEFMVRLEQIRKMADERSRLIEQLNQLEAELQHARSKTNQLEAELQHARSELDDIRHSVGYKIMRSYGPRIDQLLPDGTSRGALRKKVVAGLRTLTGKKPK